MGKPIHGHCINGTSSPTYRVWYSMLSRCENKKNKRYSSYGGRGITVCERWRTFDNFLSDMGVRPDGKSIDRIDNEKGYSPENCRWATNVEQQRNKSNNHLVTHNGLTKTLVEWAEYVGMRQMKLVQRLHWGWEFADAIKNELVRNPKRNITQSNNKTGCTGVSFHKASKKYWARIQKNGVVKDLGLFDSLDDAITARKYAEKEIKNGIQQED